MKSDRSHREQAARAREAAAAAEEKTSKYRSGFAAPPLDDGPAGEAGEGDGDEAERRAARVDAAGHGQRLDRWLLTLAGEFSRSHLQALIAGGDVRVQGQVVTSRSRLVAAGQEIEVTLRPTAQSQAFHPEPMALAIVYEDEHVIVLDKPAGLVVHPAPGHWSGTLLHGLLAHHAGAAALPRAGLVHRLDKDTSGLMVVARTLPAMTALVRAMASREVRREYLALAHGVPCQAAFTIDRPIGRDPVSRVRMAIVAEGRAARTDFAVVAAREGVAALRCKLHTGRTHQIRVHLASCGHPLVADALYGGRPALGLQRQALHAAHLSFAHPVEHRTLDFEAAPPADLAAAWQRIAPDSLTALHPDYNHASG